MLVSDVEQLDAALAQYRQILGIPLSAQDYYNRGTLRNQQSSYRDALRDFDLAIEMGLDAAELHHNRGIALFHLQQPGQALECVELALQQAQGDAAAMMHNTKGYILQSMQRVREARTCYEMALSFNPEMPLARLNLGIANLTLGDWAEGWANYEWRWSGAHEVALGRFVRIETPLPQWRGEPVNTGDGLLAFAEQGLGDTLQFCRYLPLLCERFKRVSLVCPQVLERLLRASFGEHVEIFTTVPVEQHGWQWHCPLMSLPLGFHTTLGNVPSDVPYLLADPEASNRWLERLRPVSAEPRPRIGLCWAGASGLKDDAKRSMALAELTPLLEMEEVTWISLQLGDAAIQHSQLSAGQTLLDWTHELHDFADTASLVSQLDLVITVDTAVAHLAGALGKPVWLFNRFEGEWRWLQGREDSPWYPTMRVFTQAAPGDWATVVSQVQNSLRLALCASSFTATPTN